LAGHILLDTKVFKGWMWVFTTVDVFKRRGC